MWEAREELGYRKITVNKNRDPGLQFSGVGPQQALILLETLLATIGGTQPSVATLEVILIHS